MKRWRWSWAWFLGACLVTMGASCPKPPTTDPPDPPPEPPAVCMPGVPWCHETGQACSTPDAQCKHNPTSDPDHCELAEDCPPTTPEPPVEPPGPPDHPDDLPCPPRPGTASWSVVEPKPNAPLDKMVAVNEAIKVLRLEQPERFTSAGNCLAGWVNGQQADEFFYEVAVILTRTNVCAGQFVEDGGKRSDALGVLASGRDRWLEFHLINYGDGCILPVASAYKATWIDELAGSPPLPGPDPEPGLCTDPDPRGRPAYFTLKCGQGNGTVCDSTYKVDDRAYCHATCSPLEPWVCFERDACPMRFEGDPEREVCYDEVVAPQKWWCDGQVTDPLDENPARARCTGIVKTCTADGATCTEQDASP